MPQVDLPIIESCDDCGACCLEMNSPPGYVVFYAERPCWPKDTGDHERFARLPAEAKRLLDEYVQWLRLATKVHEDAPCIWLDLDSRRCRFYEHRPSICRDLELGGEGCRGWREQYQEITGEVADDEF